MLRILGFVIEDDQHYSPARIAGLVAQIIPSLKATHKNAVFVIARFQRADSFLYLTQRFSLGYNVGRLWRQAQETYFLRK